MLGAVYIEESQATMTVVKPDSPKEQTKTIKRQTGQSYEYWQWGDDNNLPGRLTKATEGNVLLPEVINFKRDLLASGGLVYGYEKIDGNRRILEPIIDSEIEEYIERSNTDAYINEASQDAFTFGNIFPEFLLNLRREIVGHKEVDASEGRLEKQALTGRAKGRIQNVYFSANWDDSVQDDLSIVSALDTTFQMVEQVKQGKAHRYCIPIREQTRGSKYYARSPIQTLVDSGWLDVANSIPKWKKAVMDNQLSIKYHIEVNVDYLLKRFPGYFEEDEADQKKKSKQLVKEFTTVMEGKENAGKAVMSWFENKNGVEQVGWKITPIQGNQFGEKTYIEDATASDFHIAYSQGVDPTLMGVSSRNGMSAGSGSDKRMALNQLILRMRPQQRQVVTPYQLAASVNNWHKKVPSDSRLVFQFQNFHIATLDQVSSETVNPLA